MSGHLSLKWNNHSSSLLKSLIKVQSKEQYCDATIACQGKYFPVHRIVLSTCSEYFEEIFERIQKQHPYIIFKDIEPREMELLLNYMYQGEVNVLQENLPLLIKAAEALKIKGLAVPDDIPTKEQTSKKRSSTSSEFPQSKRRYDERKRRRESNETLISSNDMDRNFSSENYEKIPSVADQEELRVVKEEPADTGYEDNSSKNFELPHLTDEKNSDSNNDIPEFSNLGTSTYVKDENIDPDETFENQSSSWPPTFDEEGQVGNLPVQDDIYNYNQYATTYEGYSGKILSHSPLKSETSLLTAFEGGSSSDQNEGTVASQIGIVPRTQESASLLIPVASKIRNFVGDNCSQTPNKTLKIKRFSCPMCPAKFHLKTDLKRHILVHTGERPFSCPRCSRKFRRESHLRNHLSKKFACTF